MFTGSILGTYIDNSRIPGVECLEFVLNYQSIRDSADRAVESLYSRQRRISLTPVPKERYKYFCLHLIRYCIRKNHDSNGQSHLRNYSLVEQRT